MTQSERATTRISPSLAGFIQSLSENENAATRALILIGADQLDLDPTQVADDLRVTLGARLPPAVYAKLLTLWNRVDHGALTRGVQGPGEFGERQGAPPWTIAQERVADGGSSAATPPVCAEQRAPPEPADRADPFSGLGFDFDEPVA